MLLLHHDHFVSTRSHSLAGIDSDEMQLRRTLVGSFAACSLKPASSTPASSIAYGPSSLHVDTPQCGRHSPAPTKQRLVPTSQHDGTPQLDRSIDLFCLSKAHIRQKAVCEEILASQNCVHDFQALFKLPVTIRRRIYDYCFDDEPRKISLSPQFATKAVFPVDYFASPWDVLQPVFGALQAFSSLRRELMIYFWTRYHFHVTLSPFTGPKFSPLSSVWLLRYLDIIQYLSIEADLTRFGSGPSLLGAKVSHNVNKTEVLMMGVVEGLATRRGMTTMAEFSVMCRRYVVFQPCNDDAPFGNDPFPYCPNESLYFCDSVKKLRGLLKKARVSGFTKEYALKLFRTIFDEDDYGLSLTPGKESAWPPVFVETPSFKPNQLLLELMSPCIYEPLSYTPACSLSENVKHEMYKYESSVQSEEMQTAGTSITAGTHIPKSMTASALAKALQNCQECVTAIANPNDLRWSGPQLQDLVANSGELTPMSTVAPIHRYATPEPLESRKTNESQSRCQFSNNDIGGNLLTPTSSNDLETYSLQSLNQSRKSHLAATLPLTALAPTPQSPNAMNRRNEQDPAFIRTMDALRLLVDGRKPNVITKGRAMSLISPPAGRQEIEVGVRAQTSLGKHPQSESTVQRYLTFLKRLTAAKTDGSC